MSNQPAESEQTPSTSGWRFRPGLTVQILIGIGLGVACGLFFGEYCAFFKTVGNGFVGLLQMTVLPYITIALIVNVGRLTLAKCRRFALTAVAVLLGFWLLAITGLVIMPLAFPDMPSASFFSTSLLSTPEPIDFVQLFIPSNPFNALANSIVPAVVLFSLFLGAAIIGMKNKRVILDELEFLVVALGRVNGFVVRLTPLGVFAIAAGAASTMSIAEFGRLEAYLIVYTGAVALMCFWLLPMLVSACTPFSYRDVMGASRDAMITAFATAKLFVVLPLLIEQSKHLFHRHHMRSSQADAETEALVPLAYPFPHCGKLLSLLFIPFTAWFGGNAMKWIDYPGFIAAGMLSYFGSPAVAMPFLLDMQELPADMFQLFLLAGVYGARAGDMLGAMHLLAFTLLVTCALNGWLQIQLKRLVYVFATTLGLSVIIVYGIQLFLKTSLPGVYDRDAIVPDRLVLLHTAPSRIDPESPTRFDDKIPGESRVQRIHRTGVLRVGYHPDNLPFSFFNSKGDLVGFDIDVAYLLAKEMECSIDFVEMEFDRLADQLKNDEFDLAMSGIAITTTRLREMRFSDAYMNATLAFVVPDHHDRNFSHREKIQDIAGLRIGVRRSEYFEEKLQAYLPQAEIVPLDSPREFFENANHDMDALLVDAESGSAWTWQYPRFQVVIPKPDVVAVPLAYPVSQHDENFAEFVSQWIELKKQGRDYPDIYNHWILGQSATPPAPRWCVIRDVLHWVD